MKRMLLALPLLAACAAPGREYQDRWFFITRGLTKDEEVTEFRRLAATAAAHGYNGVCWSGLEGIARFDAARLARVEQVKAICAEHGLELIPLVFSVGYGGAALGFDRNLAVGFPVRGLTFRVEGKTARFAPEAAAVFANPGFEEARGDRAAGWTFHDRPGEVSFIDREVKHSGEASLRLDAEAAGRVDEHAHARAMQAVAVKPYRGYRARVWLKAEGVGPAGAMRLQVYGGQDGPNLVAVSVREETFDWREVSVTFNSQGFEQVRLYVGTWGARRGRFWIDDVSLEEIGLNNVLRREGCPLTVTGADGAVYEEGRDFEPVADPRLLDFSDRPSPTIELTGDSRIPDGATLLVDAYVAGQVADRQISVCMSAPRLYEHYEQVAAKLAEVLPSRKFLLSMDEIRQGGTDLADRNRGLSMAEILGDCVTRQQEILRRYHPGATCYIWSDMFDPNHNAHGNYYQVEGDFTGSWEHIPRDLVMACWYGSKCEQSLAFFENLGHRTLGAAYYDADDLTGSQRWLEALERTPHATGIMYTTWRHKYELLGPFGDLVRQYAQR